MVAELEVIREELAETRTAAESAQTDAAASGAAAAYVQQETARLRGTPTIVAPEPDTGSVGGDSNHGVDFCTKSPQGRQGCILVPIMVISRFRGVVSSLLSLRKSESPPRRDASLDCPLAATDAVVRRE